MYEKPTKAERARNLRYRKPALQMCEYDRLVNELDEIMDECDETERLLYSSGSILDAAFEGDDEGEMDFKMSFSQLYTKAQNLADVLYSSDMEAQDFNDCIVALIGNRYELVGFDSVEEDYYSLDGYDAGLAVSDAGKRLMRLTKAEMISRIGQCLGILLSFIDVRDEHQSLKATMDIIRDENTSLSDLIRQVFDAHKKASKETEGFRYKSGAAYDRYVKLLDELPDWCFVV